MGFWEVFISRNYETFLMGLVINVSRTDYLLVYSNVESTIISTSMRLFCNLFISNQQTSFSHLVINLPCLHYDEISILFFNNKL